MHVCGEVVVVIAIAGAVSAAMAETHAPGRRGCSPGRCRPFGLGRPLGGARPIRRGRAGAAAVQLVEARQDVANLRQLFDIDFAAPDEAQDDFAQFREGLGAPPVLERFVEASPAFARAALEDIANDTGLGEGGLEEGSKRAAQLRSVESPAAAAS